MKPKMSPLGKFICANKGCAKRTFLDEENGPIYESDKNGDPGVQVGEIKDGEVSFYD